MRDCLLNMISPLEWGHLSNIKITCLTIMVSICNNKSTFYQKHLVRKKTWARKLRITPEVYHQKNKSWLKEFFRYAFVLQTFPINSIHLADVVIPFSKKKCFHPVLVRKCIKTARVISLFRGKYFVELIEKGITSYVPLNWVFKGLINMHYWLYWPHL